MECKFNINLIKSFKPLNCFFDFQKGNKQSVVCKVTFRTLINATLSLIECRLLIGLKQPTSEGFFYNSGLQQFLQTYPLNENLKGKSLFKHIWSEEDAFFTPIIPCTLGTGPWCFVSPLIMMILFSVPGSGWSGRGQPSHGYVHHIFSRMFHFHFLSLILLSACGARHNMPSTLFMKHS